MTRWSLHSAPYNKGNDLPILFLALRSWIHGPQIESPLLHHSRPTIYTTRIAASVDPGLNTGRSGFHLQNYAEVYRRGNPIPFGYP